MEFLALKWSVTKHFKEYLNISTFYGQNRQQSIDIHPHKSNLDAMGHRWVGASASFEFASEYQKGEDNGADDALSWVPICNSHEMVCYLMEGAIMGIVDQSEAGAS